MIDRFFDSLNVNNFNSGKWKRKPFQDPYRSADDFRLKVLAATCYHDVIMLSFSLSQWLEETFLGYLKEWEDSVSERVCFTIKERKNILLSQETLDGIEITGNCILVAHVHNIYLQSMYTISAPMHNIVSKCIIRYCIL